MYESLAEKGQSPRALVLACIDSRVDPARIFDAGPGELLIVRNVAALAPPYGPDQKYHGTSAALEFGVRVLEVRDLIVLGHGLCGGVKALLEGGTDKQFEFITPWMSVAEPARTHIAKDAPPEVRQRQCEFEVIRISLANLMSFPWVSERVAAGTLQLHGAWFDIRYGQLMTLRPDGSFQAEESTAGQTQ